MARLRSSVLRQSTSNRIPCRCKKRRHRHLLRLLSGLHRLRIRDERAETQNLKLDVTFRALDEFTQHSMTRQCNVSFAPRTGHVVFHRLILHSYDRPKRKPALLFGSGAPVHLPWVSSNQHDYPDPSSGSRLVLLVLFKTHALKLRFISRTSLILIS